MAKGAKFYQNGNKAEMVENTANQVTYYHPAGISYSHSAAKDQTHNIQAATWANWRKVSY